MWHCSFQMGQLFRLIPNEVLFSSFFKVSQAMKYTKEALVKLAKFSSEDLEIIGKRRKAPYQLGFAYQFAFVKLHNRFPNQQPLEMNQEILNYVSIQLEIPTHKVETYDKRQKTVSDHQEEIRHYLNLQRFSDATSNKLEQFIFLHSLSQIIYEL